MKEENVEIEFPTWDELGVTSRIKPDYRYAPWDAMPTALAEKFEILNYIAAKRMGAAVKLLDDEDMFAALASTLRKEAMVWAATSTIPENEKREVNEALDWVVETAERATEFLKALATYCQD